MGSDRRIAAMLCDAGWVVNLKLRTDLAAGGAEDSAEAPEVRPAVALGNPGAVELARRCEVSKGAISQIVATSDGFFGASLWSPNFNIPVNVGR
jgi:hypothetical protein